PLAARDAELLAQRVEQVVVGPDTDTNRLPVQGEADGDHDQDRTTMAYQTMMVMS
ncbi:MAG: hypothetical protein HYY05_04990, partial [Chloroflexi bacterium]|nr:hypothetical protein [Chloroflexota bacterium]